MAETSEAFQVCLDGRRLDRLGQKAIIVSESWADKERKLCPHDSRGPLECCPVYMPVAAATSTQILFVHLIIGRLFSATRSP
jgi:hypothetical protein